MGKGGYDFFFLYYQPARVAGRFTGIDQAADRTSGTDAARKTASVERKDNLKLLKLQKRVCVFVGIVAETFTLEYCELPTSNSLLMLCAIMQSGAYSLV